MLVVPRTNRRGEGPDGDTDVEPTRPDRGSVSATRVPPEAGATPRRAVRAGLTGGGDSAGGVVGSAEATGAAGSVEGGAEGGGGASVVVVVVGGGTGDAGGASATFPGSRRMRITAARITKARTARRPSNPPIPRRGGAPGRPEGVLEGMEVGRF